MELINME